MPTANIASIAVIDVRIKQGATWRMSLNYKSQFKKPYDLSGCRAHMQMRDVNGVLLADLSTDNGTITLNTQNVLGNIDLYIADEDTAKMNFTTGNYDFFLLYPNGDADCIFKGKVTFEKAQTVNG